MFFITKRKVRRMLLQLMNGANDARKTIEEDPDATEQDKRDAFMFVSGCIYCVCRALTILRGESDGTSSIREHIRGSNKPCEERRESKENGECAEDLAARTKES